MALNTSLQLKQQQKLVMTPMLQQALKVLQLNNLELASLVQQECSENPMLEEAGSEEAAVEEGESSEPVEAAPEEAAREGEAGEAVDEEPARESPREEEPPEAPAAPAKDEVRIDEKGTVADESWEDYFDDNGTDYGYARESGDDDKEGFESFLTRPESLQEHLMAQLEAAELEGAARAAAEEIVGAVDERGYLSTPLEEIGRRSGIPSRDLYAALNLVQGFDPAGVAARDLRECLLLQLSSQGLRNSLAWRLASDHLKDLEKRRYAELGQELKAGPGEMEEALRVLGALEPMPGRAFGWVANPAITVDAEVEKDADGNYQVSVPDAQLPKLAINQYYKKMLKAAGAEHENTRAYLNEKYQSALWLIKSIEQRKRTLQRVVESIVEHQKGFLDHGLPAFRPLTLKEIAAQTGLHESTISRVTTNKHVQTPRGIFEMKFFFSGGLGTDQGGSASTPAVKEKLRQLVETEPPQDPHSDQRLAELMKGQGIRIARRTVAKYREEMRILPAHQRKRVAQESSPR